MVKKKDIQKTSRRSYQNLLTSAIGDIGKWQMYMIFAEQTPNIFVGWSMVMISFSCAETKWWRQSTFHNTTSNETKSVRYFQNCTMNGDDDVIVYEDPHTIIAEWDLICNLSYIPTWITTAQMVGVLVGATLFGQLGDWIGRQKCIFITYTLTILFILLESFCYNWKLMMVCSVLLGCAIGGFLVLNFVYIMEYIGTSWRTAVGLIPFWSSGMILLGGLYSLLPQWRYLCIWTAAMGSPFIVLLWWIPESTRWLITCGKVDKAIEILNKIAHKNKRPVPDLSELKTIVEEEESQERKTFHYNFISLFKFKETRWKCPLFGFFWFTCSYSYYALTFGISLLEGDKALNMTLMGVAEIASSFLAWLIAKKFGRKISSFILLVLTSTMSFGITIAFVLNVTNVELVKRILALISQFFLSASMNTIEIFTVEMFPTTLRSTAYAFVSVCGYVGGIVSPQSEPLYRISKHIPYTINGVLAILSALGVLFLHDTYTCELHDNLQDEIDENEYKQLVS